MPSAWIIQRHALVRLHSRRLQIFAFPEESDEAEASASDPVPDDVDGLRSGKRHLVRQVPLIDLERLIIDQSVTLTSAATAELLRQNIPIAVLARNGRYLGGFLPATPAHSRWRLLQYERSSDAVFSLTQARKIILAKIYNQRRMLQRLASGRGEGIDAALNPMRRLLERSNRASSPDDLRGLEGSATAVYFECWARFLPPAFPFERRSRRPPLNPVNAVLSFTYTILYNEFTALLHAHGLDPGLGCLHATENGRWALALDLIEPFRPIVAEALALDLFSRQILNETHFEPWNSGIYLNREGRFKLILQLEKRLEREFISEHAGHRTSLRRQLETQVISFKAALEDSDKFQPFRVN